MWGAILPEPSSVSKNRVGFVRRFRLNVPAFAGCGSQQEEFALLSDIVRRIVHALENEGIWNEIDFFAGGATAHARQETQ